MTIRSRKPRLGAAAALALLTLLGSSCDSNDTTAAGPVAVFTPEKAAPQAGDIAMLAGPTLGAAVSVRITVTGVPSFFGTAFRVSYDTNALLFTGMVTDDSFLLDGTAANNVVFSYDAVSVPGEIILTATRINPLVAPPIDVTATDDLLVLGFTARKPIAGGATEGLLAFVDPRQVCDGTVSAPGCGSIAVTWWGGGVSTK